jgi:hypothetical protein
MKYFFLLGGSDLEMQEIENILAENNIEYENLALTWSDASWEKYSDIANKKIKEGYTVVGVELFNKEYKPPKALDIDHHNERRCEPAAIEQVAHLLDVELNAYQKLVAANDKGHIPGLIRAGASYNQIKEIRKKEHDIQGITNKDLEKVRQAIRTSELINNVTVIRYNEEKFLPVSDLLYENVLEENKDNLSAVNSIPHIIYNDDKLLYSGKVTGELIKNYENEIDENKIYYGGYPESGYFGTVKGKFTAEELNDIKETILNLYKNGKMQTKDMYSYHIFLFPFRWKIWDTGEDTKLNKKFSLDKFNELLSEDSNWQRNKFQLTNGTAYNEYNYFYDFVREILYDLDDELQTTTNISNTRLIQHYSYTPADIKQNNDAPMCYNIQVNDKKYQLEVDSILLNMYATGVGVLSFHLRNRKHKNPNDILTINKFGRRLFPPFFNLEDNGILTGEDNTPPSEWLCGVKNIELPEKIWLSRGDETIAEEDWVKYKNSDTFKHGPFTLPAFISKLFPENFFLTHEKLGAANHKIYLRPALDDRMYTVCWYGNETLINNLTTSKDSIVYHTYQKSKLINERNIKKYKTAVIQYPLDKNEFWHNFVFLDTNGNKTFQNQIQLHEYLEKHTYSRWIDYGTLYGMSRYSLVMLTGENAPAFLIKHLQTLYYKMAELSLLQRATLVSFSDEVTHVSDLVHSDEEKAMEKIEELYKHYILFVNKIYFREVTAQEQGIEMYDMMQRIMRIPEQVKDLDNEIAELNSFAAMIADKNEKNEMKTHTLLATFFLPAMAIAGLLGMNTISTEFTKNPNATLIHDYPFLISLLFIGISTFLVWLWMKLKNKNERIGLFTLLLWFGTILLFYLYIKNCV